jgi:hypothetical protein
VAERIGGRTALLLLAGLVLCLNWKLLLTGEYSWLTSPHTARQTLPRLAFQAEELRHLRLPLWNPYPGGGESLASRPDSGWADPLLWAVATLPRPGGWFSQAGLHWYFVLVMRLLPAALAYGLARRLGCTRAAAVLGGFAYSALGWMGQAWSIEEAPAGVWIPLCASLLIDTARGEARLRRAAIAGFVLGLCALSGNAPVVLQASAAALAYWLVFLWTRPGWRSVGAVIVYWLAASACGALAWLCAPADLWRKGLTWDAIPLVGIPGIFLAVPSSPAAWYCGSGVLLLAGLAIWNLRRQATVRWLAVILLGGWLGSPALAGLAMAMLAARGVDLIRKPVVPGLAMAALAVGATLLAVVTWGLPAEAWRNGVALAALECLLAAALLTAFRHDAIGARGLFGGWLALAAIAATNGGVSSLPSADQPDQAAPLQSLAVHGTLARRLALEIGQSRVWVDPAVAAYDFGSWYGVETAPSEASPELKRLLGTQYRLARTPSPPYVSFVHDNGLDMGLYRAPEASPRTYVVHRVSVLPKGEQTEARLARPGFNPAEETFVDRDPPRLETCGAPDLARIIRRRPGETVLEVEAGCRGLVVLADNWDPGWRVTVDGRSAEPWRAYGTVLGAVVPAGSHQVVFRFSPPAVEWGVTLGLAAAAAAAASLASLRRRSPAA